MNCLQYDGDLLVVVEKRHYFGTLVHSSQKYINSQIFFLEHTVLQGYTDKMSNDKTANDKTATDKISKDKTANDKMSNATKCLK